MTASTKLSVPYLGLQQNSKPAPNSSLLKSNMLKPHYSLVFTDKQAGNWLSTASEEQDNKILNGDIPLVI
ncbi:UNVERIFIED_CONTAM: hypothetical protein FKN15_057942 [Acipenser sinensis]